MPIPPNTPTPPRLLILDGPQTHQSLEFIEFAQKANIILLSFPSHTTHLLQPLDVAIISRLKNTYKGEIDQLCQDSVDFIGKEDFLEIYSSIRDIVFTPDAQRYSFASTSIIPFNSGVVLNRLSLPLQTSSTPEPSDLPLSQQSQQLTNSSPQEPETEKQIWRYLQSISKVNSSRKKQRLVHQTGSAFRSL